MSEEFLAKLRKIYNQVDYYRFLELTGFDDDRYSLEKYNTLQDGIEKLCKFDGETLAKLIA